MGRNILNVSAGPEPKILGAYYVQDNGIYGKGANNHNGTYQWVTKHTSGTNYWNNDTNQTGYTIKDANSYLRVRWSANADHGTTWRSNAWLLYYTTNNWSSETITGGFGITLYNGTASIGGGSCQERVFLHGSSVGTVYKFGIKDSTHSGGNTYTYNNINIETDSGGGTQNSFGPVFCMALRVEEISASEVSAMHSSNTFATGGT